MVTALHEHLGAAQCQGLLDLPVEFVECDDVGIGIFLSPPEGAKLAVDVANVGVIDVAIHDVGHGLRPTPSQRTTPGQPTTTIRQRAQLRQGQRVQSQCLLSIDPSPFPNPLKQSIP